MNRASGTPATGSVRRLAGRGLRADVRRLGTAQRARGCSDSGPLKNVVATYSWIGRPRPGPPTRVATAGEALPARRDYFGLMGNHADFA